MNDFYGADLFEQVIKDPFKYRGKGRSRKTDYITVREASKKFNTFWNEYLKLKIKQIYPPVKIKIE